MEHNKLIFSKVPTLRFSNFVISWSKSILGNLCKLSSGTTPSRVKGNNFNGNIYWLTSGELKKKWIIDTEEKITEDTRQEYNLTLFPQNTLVIAIYGLEAAGVRGTCGILQSPATISQACMAIQPKNNSVSSEFLYSWYKKYGNLIGIKYAQGTKQQNLCFDIVNRLPIYYPTLEEQQKISDFIDKIDSRIEVQNKIIKHRKSLIFSFVIEVFLSLLSLIESVLSLNVLSFFNNLLKLLWTIFKEVKRLWSKKKT